MNKSRHNSSFTRSMLVLLLGGFVVAAFLSGCRATLQPTQPASQSSTQASSHSVSYKGVTFSFEPTLASEVRTETRPQVTEGKPSDIVPEHPSFILANYPSPRALSEGTPQIRVFSTPKFREAMHLAGVEMGKSTVPPSHDDWALWLDEEVRVLRALLERRPDLTNAKSFIRRTRDPHFPTMGNDYPQMPFLPMWEATQAFVAHLKYINFKNGKGVFFLTQWNTETSQVTNDGLEYAFQGITDDGRYWIYAEFAVTAPGLPRDSDSEVVAWNEKKHLVLHRSEKYQTYLRPVIAKLEALDASQFQPKLGLLEQLIQSLEVRDE